jgi:hypothetical protein
LFLCKWLFCRGAGLYYVSMFRNVLMLVLSACAVAGDAAILVWFFRRLRKIQVDLWGKDNVKPFRVSFALRRQPAPKA